MLQTLVSPIENDDAGLKIHQDAWIYRTTLQAGNTLSHTLHSPMHGAYIFVIDGKLDAHGNTLGKRDALGVSETDSISMTAVETCDVLIFEVPMLR